MLETPQTQHEWLHRLVGRWRFTQESAPGANEPPVAVQGTLVGESLGGLWVMLECTGKSVDSPDWKSIFYLGYDSKKNKFVGSFIASMMHQQWIYEGDLDEASNSLTLNTEGPSFDGKELASYQDIIEVVDAEHWTLRSQVQMPDGNWHPFMTAHYERA